MSRAYPHSKRKSARTYSRWSAVFDACCAVIEQAATVRMQSVLVTATGTSRDTWDRCTGSPGFGGWSANRVQALMDFEIQHIGDNSIQRAWLGTEAAPITHADLDHTADKALLSAINLAREIAEKKPDGLDRAELRALCAILPETIADLAGFLREAKATLKGNA